MGKVLLYPLLVLVLLAVIVPTCVCLIAMVKAWREARAVREARWEVYTQDIGGGKDEVGIQLVARWGRHQRVLHRNDHPFEVPAGDTEALLQAQFDAETQATTNNSLRVGARDQWTR
jgi:hypothetical protein